MEISIIIWFHRFYTIAYLATNTSIISALLLLLYSLKHVMCSFLGRQWQIGCKRETWERYMTLLLRQRLGFVGIPFSCYRPSVGSVRESLDVESRTESRYKRWHRVWHCSAYPPHTSAWSPEALQKRSQFKETVQSVSSVPSHLRRNTKQAHCRRHV